MHWPSRLDDKRDLKSGRLSSRSARSSEVDPVAYVEQRVNVAAADSMMAGEMPRSPNEY